MQLASYIDDLGKPAWIALMVISFILFWPLGLAILGFLLWSGRMGWGCHRRDFGERRARFIEAGQKWCATRKGESEPSSGNTAFDEYKAETLKRLQQEQAEFVEFLNRLRKAKDKAEFDQFMAERKGGGEAEPTPQN